MFLHRLILSFNQYLFPTNRWFILCASVPVALATGTLFVYSAYSTQLAERCGLDASQTGNLNIAATIGSSIGAVLSGIVTDMYGTQLPILASCTFLSLGYYSLYTSYIRGLESTNIELLVAMFLVGLGSVAGYFSSLKAIAISFPDYKGSAQSVTIASFAISSLMYSLISNYLNDTGIFLKFLYCSSASLLLIGFLLIRVEGRIDNPGSLEHDLIDDIRQEFEYLNGNNFSIDSPNHTPNNELRAGGSNSSSDNTISTAVITEETHLVNPRGNLIKTNQNHKSRSLKHMNLKQSLCHPIFWYHYFIFSITQGFGQMYIYSVGFILKAIHFYFQQKSPVEISLDLRTLQTIHVSVIAVASFVGRLTSGPVSDLITKRGFQRHWILILGSLFMGVGHCLYLFNIGDNFNDITAANVYLVLISFIIGFAYGFTFTCYPVVVSDLFSMDNYSLIWGCIYTSTTFGLTFMTKIFGFFYDRHTTWDKHYKAYICPIGSACYHETFEITTMLNIFVIMMVLLYIYLRK